MSDGVNHWPVPDRDDVNDGISKSHQHTLFLQQLIDKVPDVVIIVDSDGIFRFVSKAAETLWGYKPEEMVGRPFIDFVDPGDHDRTLQIAGKIVKGESIYSFENTYIKKDGLGVPVIWSAYWDNDDNLIYGVARNATEIKDTESMLVESETLLSESQRLAKMGSWNFDFRTDRLIWSDALYDVFEADRETFKETHGSFLSLIDDDDRERALETSRNTQLTGDPFNIRYRITTPKGNRKIIEEYGYSEKDVNGTIVRLFGTAQDITERVMAENEIRDSRERYKKVFDYDPLPKWIYDLETYTFLDVNQKALDTYGYSKEEFLSMTIMDIRPKEDIPLMERLHHDVSHMDKSHFGVYTHLKKNGEPLRMDVTGHQMQYLGRDCMLVVCVDVTENERLNDELLQRAKELEISNADLERFAYVASHDLQEPLRMIASFMALLDKKYHDKLDDKARQYIHFAVDGAKRMRQIILDLLDFSRFGGNDGERELIDLNELVDEFKLLRRRLINEMSAIIHSDKLPVILAHGPPVTLVFHNLLDNALKYSKKGVKPEIWVSYLDNDEYWEFAIRDNGEGIEEEYFDKIFVIFQRLHHSGSVPGSGMGLATTKRIIESYGGKIWLESTPNEGSTFHFTIPKHSRLRT